MRVAGEIIILIYLVTVLHVHCQEYAVGVSSYGYYLGELQGLGTGQTGHGVKGHVYAINGTHLYFKDFSYDGLAPDAKFYAGFSGNPNSVGEIIPDEENRLDPLGKYNDDSFFLKLPELRRINYYRWIAIYCTTFQVSFGHIVIPTDYTEPSLVSLGVLGFELRVHNVRADDVIVMNSNQLLFRNLDYDGLGPNAHFWIGNGTEPDENGVLAYHPSEERSRRGNNLPAFSNEDVLLTLPEKYTVYNIDYVGLWCIPFNQNFGHVNIPKNLNVPVNTSLLETTRPIVDVELDNCIVLIPERFHASWGVDENRDVIQIELAGIVPQNDYMAFGISGSNSRTQMVGSDVTVVWYDSASEQPRAVDYNLTAYSQCVVAAAIGACPDDVSGGQDHVTLVSYSRDDGVTRIKFQRPLEAAEDGDMSFPLDRFVYISWGIGSINPQGHVSRHSVRTPGNLLINFGQATSSCPEFPFNVEPTEAPLEPWVIPPLTPASATYMEAVIGPAGGERGYEGITGRVGWGFAWYIQGYLIPEINVIRGNTYYFLIRGGNDNSVVANYHPFYITDSIDGGYDQKTPQEQQEETIYAGPISGALCEWTNAANPTPDAFETFNQYKATLTKTCRQPGNPAVLVWTPDENTPDVLYYQCYVHKYFGWRINVMDSGTTTTQSPTSTTTITVPTTPYQTPTTTLSVIPERARVLTELLQRFFQIICEITGDTKPFCRQFF